MDGQNWVGLKSILKVLESGWIVATETAVRKFRELPLREHKDGSATETWPCDVIDSTSQGGVPEDGSKSVHFCALSHGRV